MCCAISVLKYAATLFLYWLPFNHNFLRLFFVVTTIEQIFMSDHLHKFGTEVLCFQKWLLLSGCGGTESLNLPDVAGYQRRLCNALVFLMLLDLAISIHKWESTVSCSPYQREHPTLKDLITWDIWIFFLLGLDSFPHTFPLRMLPPPHHPNISLLCLLLIFFSPSLSSVFTTCFSALPVLVGAPLLPSLFTSV